MSPTTAIVFGLLLYTALAAIVATLERSWLVVPFFYGCAAVLGGIAYGCWVLATAVTA